MSQSILIEEDENFSKLLSINLQTYTGVDVILKPTAQEAIDLLKLLPTIDLIIVGKCDQQKKSVSKIYSYLKNNNLHTSMILLGEYSELSDEILCLKSDVEWELVVKHACSLLSVSADDLHRKITPDYIPVSIEYFYDIDLAPCDIYIRIKNTPSDFQYVKRLHSQDCFNSREIDKYKSQGLNFFYVLKDYQQYFVNFLTSSLILKLEKTDLPIFERILTNSKSYDVVSDKIQMVGMDDAIAELATTSINSMIKSVKDSPRLSYLLKILISSKISYAYQHAHLVVVIGEFILSKQRSYDATDLDIFTTAAFFGDITLKSIDQIRINSDADLLKSSLGAEEKNDVRKHALVASELIREHPSHSEHLERVIREHHGQKNGIGFADSPSESIHPVAKIFIIADAFVKIILDPKSPREKADILTLLYSRFSEPSFQAIIKTLEPKID